MSLPKPQLCGQKWLDMKPVPGGRLCGKCEKTIVDFSKMKWAEIEQMQKEHHNSLCGMYTPRQLDHWGHEAPKKNPAKLFAATALLVSLAASQVLAQTAADTTCKKTIIRGTVRDKESKEVIFPVNIVLKGVGAGATTDFDGHFVLDVTNYIDTMPNPKLVFTSIGYDKLEYELKNTRGNIRLNPELEINTHATTFYVNYVAPETPWDKAKQKIWNFFAPKP